MSHDISEDRLYYFEEQEVVVPDLATSGYILDLGGGGEGVIGRLKPDQVVAIDPNKRELRGAPPGPLKVVMDGRDLRFLDNAFSAATAFFTFMYITPTDHGRVFNEVFRVLQNGAPFFVWDVALPLQEDREGDFAVFPLVIRLPGEAISTGYGARWPEEVVDLDHYDRLARSTGFEVVATESDGRLLRLHLRKPDPGGP